MKAEVFDDWKSVAHSVIGGLSYFFPLSVSFSWHTRLQSTLSYERTKHALSATLWSFVSVTRSSDCYVSLSGGEFVRW
jgi:hypothetical protein